MFRGRESGRAASTSVVLEDADRIERQQDRAEAADAFSRGLAAVRRCCSGVAEHHVLRVPGNSAEASMRSRLGDGIDAALEFHGDGPDTARAASHCARVERIELAERLSMKARPDGGMATAGRRGGGRRAHVQSRSASVREDHRRRRASRRRRSARRRFIGTSRACGCCHPSSSNSGPASPRGYVMPGVEGEIDDVIDRRGDRRSRRRHQLAVAVISRRQAMPISPGRRSPSTATGTRSRRR